MNEIMTSERVNKENAIALANKIIPQQLDLVSLMILQRDFKAAKLNLRQIQESIAELEQTLNNLTK